MDALLFTLTVVSLVAAALFGAITWRALAAERRRSAARGASLSAASDGGAAGGGAVGSGTVGSGTVPSGTVPRPVAVATMFTTAPGASLKSRPFIKAAAVGVMAVIIVIAVAMSSSSSRDEVPPSGAAASQQAAPLELVSMRHAREGTSLTVSGLVRNPRAGAAATRITAVVFAFDRDGTFVASARAPLDFTTLGPGDESPFVVAIPNVANVGRYRVSFRTDAGMLRHVDRRADQVRLAAGRRPGA